MSVPGKTNAQRMAHELSYWENGGAAVYDLHLDTYLSCFPMDMIDYAAEGIMDVGSGALSVFEKIAPDDAAVTPFDVLADEYNRLSPQKKFKIQNSISTDSRFTLITLFNMLDHVDDPDDLLLFIREHLEETGRVWLAVHLYRPHGIEGHPQKFTCRTIVSLLSRYFSIESSRLIREGVPIPYMWCGVLRAKANKGRFPLIVVIRNYLAYSRMQSVRIIVKLMKTFGLRRLLPKAWQF